MSQKDQTRFVKYVFVDIVAYSERRSAEAQIEIIAVLNRAVKASVSQFMGDKEVIYIPTGDGMCIALTDFATPYDAHIQIALQLLATLSDHNQGASEERKFEIRIGLNAHEDNLVLDVNGRENLAGAGITAAQRIMNVGDGCTLLVSEAVFDSLRHRELYRNDFKEYTTVVKHEIEIKVYQYVASSRAGLKTEPPHKLANGEDEIDANYRRCLTLRSASGNERLCIRKAGDAWRNEIAGIQKLPKTLLNESMAQQYEAVFIKAKELLEDYQTFTGNLYTMRNGSMYRLFAASKRMHLERSFAMELRWIIEQIEQTNAQNNGVIITEGQRSYAMTNLSDRSVNMLGPVLP